MATEDSSLIAAHTLVAYDEDEDDEDEGESEDEFIVPKKRSRINKSGTGYFRAFYIEHTIRNY